jgi:hypothetical protein
MPGESETVKTLGLLILLVATGCGRKTDFLHFILDVPLQTFSGVHKLKELQGENKVDILWTVDNSGSMGSYQKELMQNSDAFIRDFANGGGLDWKMGVISSTITEAPVIGFTNSTLLTQQTPDGADLFQRAIRRLGTGGADIEEFFAPIERHLTTFPDFLRKNSVLALIIITDAPDQGRVKAAAFLNLLKRLKGDLKRVVTYGVFASNDFGCTRTDGNWDYAGSDYEKVIEATKGKKFKLCDTPFGKNLAELGIDLVTRIKRPFIQLKDRPVISSLRVSYLDQDLPGGPKESGGLWMYDFDMNRVAFHSLDFAPGDNEEVTIRYDVADEVIR